jgi:hypothetical protein
MDPTQVASATTLLTALGLGKYVAGIISLIGLALAVLGQIMPALPVPSALSPAWWRVTYGILARVTGSYGKNAPSPANGLPAGGIVPTPPPSK